MKSMTGFATAELPFGEGRLLAEVRSLNHRFLEVRVRLPSELNDHAFFVEQLVRERLARGRYDVGVRLDGAAVPSPTVDRERVRAAYRALAEVRDEIAPGTDLSLGALASMPDLFGQGGTIDPDRGRAALRAVIELALERIDDMRTREGDALAQELRRRLTSGRRFRDELEVRSLDTLQSYRARLRERLERILREVKVPLDAGRLEHEVALLADRSDVTEELCRLAIHFDQFERLLNLSEPVGRRLDFLLQEIAREANTAGSKSQDAELAHVVVELKAEIERLREQVQNVE